MNEGMNHGRAAGWSEKLCVYSGRMRIWITWKKKKKKKKKKKDKEVTRTDSRLTKDPSLGDWSIFVLWLVCTSHSSYDSSSDRRIAAHDARSFMLNQKQKCSFLENGHNALFYLLGYKARILENKSWVCSEPKDRESLFERANTLIVDVLGHKFPQWSQLAELWLYF